MKELSFLKENSLEYGYGRKKWWAEQIGVPQLTISHWLAGRQYPNAKNIKKIQETIAKIKASHTSMVWQDHLWEMYYQKFELSSEFLKLLTFQILQIDEIDARTLALLSLYIEKLAPDFEVPDNHLLKNKLGWLLQTAGIKPNFKPSDFKGTAPLVKLDLLNKKSKMAVKYLKSQQTRLGKYWQLYDCPINHIKEKFIWRQSTDKLLAS